MATKLMLACAVACIVNLAKANGPVTNTADLACMATTNTNYQPGDLVLARQHVVDSHDRKRS